MTPSYQYDQDPRYGWVSIEMGEKAEGLVVIHDASGKCHGFTYRDGAMTPTCICNAYTASECGCSGVDWSDDNDAE